MVLRRASTTPARFSTRVAFEADAVAHEGEAAAAFAGFAFVALEAGGTDLFG